MDPPEETSRVRGVPTWEFGLNISPIRVVVKSTPRARAPADHGVAKVMPPLTAVGV